MSDIQTLGASLIDNLERVIVGKRDALELIVVGLLCEGHVLIEDVPGVGKTMLARSLAKSLDCQFNRIQFTPDMLPSDITGVSIYNQKKGEFEFRPGPIIGQIILADEINRATPKTQAALLEAMEEHQVTVDGVTHTLPRPFMVLATQNPIEYEGTFPLPEAQLDRFLLRVRLGYPEYIDEIKILDSQRLRHPIDTLTAVMSSEQVLASAERIRGVFVSSAAKRYITELSRRTRQSTDIYLGSSPRGTLALSRAAQAQAALRGREHVLPDDIQDVAIPVLAHRIIISPAARLRELERGPHHAGDRAQHSRSRGRVRTRRFDPRSSRMNAGRALVLLLVLVGAAGAVVSGAAFYYHFLYLGVILAAAAWLSVHWVARWVAIDAAPRFQPGQRGGHLQRAVRGAQCQPRPWRLGGAA